MRTVLLAVNQSPSSFEATLYVIKFIKTYGPLTVHVVNVQPAPLPWLPHDEVQEAIEAHLAVETHTGLLHEEQIPCQIHKRHGVAARVLAAMADELGCDHIILGTRGLNAMKGMLLGSVTTEVLCMANVPVICVKGKHPDIL
jgi:nucleotide-binding universal stress UspA family protein